MGYDIQKELCHKAGKQLLRSVGRKEQKNLKKTYYWVLLLLLFLPFKIEANALRYSHTGINAAVIPYYNSENDSYYLHDTYSVPSSVSYEGLTFIVNKISVGAFAGKRESNKGSTATRIVLPLTVTSIEENAFRNCRYLAYIDLGGAETISDYAFQGCTKLPSIIIPSSVLSFGVDPFVGCNILREIIYLPTKAPANWTATSITYVPDKQSYSSPKYSMNDAHVIEMISFEESTFEYTGDAPTTSWTNNVEGYTASLSMPTLKNDAGSYEELIPVTFTNEAGNTFTTNVVYRYEITPAKLKAKVENASREYGEDNPQFKITYSGFLMGEDEKEITTIPTISTSAIKTSNAGEYPISISGGSATNYEFVYEPGILTITKAPLSAMICDTTKVYGAPNPTFSIAYTGLKNEETAPAWITAPTFQTEAKIGSGVGQYAVTAMDGAPVNYDLKEIKAGTLSITPAPLTIKANDATRQYYSDNPTFRYSCSGFVNGDSENVLSPSPNLTTSATLTSNTGTYEIEISGASSKNYSISYINGTLTITQRTLTASVGNYERLYNEDNPTFEVMYNGFVGNDNESVLHAEAIASTTATKTTDVGSYPIYVTGGAADNYRFSYASGTLTINKAEQTLLWEQELTGLKIGDQVELKATASSKLPITYTLDDNTFVEIYYTGNKYYLDCKADGQAQIVATQDGNRNYYSAARVRKMVVVGDGDAIHAIEASDIIIQGTPFGIRVTNAEIGETISVYSLNGVLQKSLKVEEKTMDILVPIDNVYLIKVGGKMVKLKL